MTTLRKSTVMDLAIDCLANIKKFLDPKDRLIMIACGDKLFSAKWAASFHGLNCTTSTWRTICGQTRVVDYTKPIFVGVFTGLHSLILDSAGNGGNNHSALNNRDICRLPQQLSHLSISLTTDTCDLPLPPNLTSLHLSNLGSNFATIGTSPLGVTVLHLKYRHDRKCLPTNLVEMTNLGDLTIHSSSPLTTKQNFMLPQSITRLALAGKGGYFKTANSFCAAAKRLTCLQTLSCKNDPMYFGAHQLNLHVLPPTVTCLSVVFAISRMNPNLWSRYPRSLRKFDDFELIVFGDFFAQRNDIFASAQDTMYQLPPCYERIALVNVTVECPLRFVTHLRLSSPFDGSTVISQAQIEACRNMASVTHLTLSLPLDHDSGLVQLGVCTWQLQYLKVVRRSSKSTHIQLDDYAPWLTPHLTELYMECTKFEATIESLLDGIKSVKIVASLAETDTTHIPSKVLAFTTLS